VGRSLWREDGSVVCSFYWSEYLGTRDHILLSQIWDFPFRRLLRLVGSRWKYSTPASTRVTLSVILGISLYGRGTDHTENTSSGLYLLLWRHCICGNVFTEPLLRNGLHNAVVPSLLGADDTENTASPIGACWTVFTELLPSNALIKSVTMYNTHNIIAES
jgi:hypothetical protein